MKIQSRLTGLLGVGAIALSLAACSAEATEAGAPVSTGSAAAAEVVIPSQAAADASATEAITEANADTAFADLEKEINADM